MSDIVVTYLERALARCGEELRPGADYGAMDLKFFGATANHQIRVF